MTSIVLTITAKGPSSSSWTGTWTLRWRQSSPVLIRPKPPPILAMQWYWHKVLLTSKYARAGIHFYLHAHLVPRNWTSLLKHHSQKLEKKETNISQWFCLGGVSSFSPRCRLNRRGEPQIPCSKKKTHWIIVCKNNCFFVCASNQRYMGWYGAPTGGAAKGSAQNESKVMGASS